MPGPPMVRDTDRIRYVQDVFRRVLKLKTETSPDDDFFSLGGTSLTAIEVLDLIEAEWGVRLPARKFYQATMIRELAGELPQDTTGSTRGA